MEPRDRNDARPLWQAARALRDADVQQRRGRGGALASDLKAREAADASAARFGALGVLKIVAAASARALKSALRVAEELLSDELRTRVRWKDLMRRPCASC